jgi:bacteriorhodopsin
MKQVEILSEIEKVLKDSFSTSAETEEFDETSKGKRKKKRKKGPVKAIFDLLVSFFISVIQSPFQLIHQFIKNELVKIVRKELKSYFILIILFGVLFTIFIVLWFLISLAIGIYFQENGFTFFHSILLVIAFQIIVFAIVSIVIYKMAGKLRSLKLLRNS